MVNGVIKMTRGTQLGSSPNITVHNTMVRQQITTQCANVVRIQYTSCIYNYTKI